MAKYEDYVKRMEQDGLDKEIEAGQQQQEERQTSTPDDIDWQKRYQDLEVAYSRQGQQMGDYRKLIDEYVSSTPNAEEASSQEVSPITPDEIYENPDEAVRRAVDSHPAIKRVNELEAELQATRQKALQEEFTARHPDYQKTIQSPEFANWVYENPTRVALAQRADKLDMTAADALFSLYEAEAKATATQSQQGVDDVSLESGHGGEPPAPERYSRSEMLEQKIRAKQGDLKAEAYVKRHAAAYRNALAQGNVRD